MRLRSVVGGVVAALGVIAAAPVAASANVVWCISDPPTQVSTTSGTNLMVNTTVALSPATPHLKSLVTEQASTAPDGHGGTLITEAVTIPVGVQSAKVLASVNRYNVSALGSGTGGSVITLYLDVPAN